MPQPAAAPRRADSARPVILTFLRHYMPGFRAGGPIRSIANLVEALADEFEFRIVTLDRDLGDSRPYAGVAPYRWTTLGNAWVMYVDARGFGLRRVATVARDTPHSLVYLNSFFDPRFTMQVLLARRLRLLPKRPLLLAPRGELSIGALQIKRFRKTAFIAAGRLARLHEGATWQATSPEEALDIQSRVPDANGRVFIAPNVVSTPVSDNQADRLVRNRDAPLRVCFLSRISRKKNLDFALRVLARVSVPVHFTIYGPVQDAQYWSECTRLMAKLPSNIRAVYEGEIPPSNVQPALRRHDVFFLPTLNENFGHVIGEALSASLVVLISDQTPWRDLERRGAGWALPLVSEDEFVRALENLASWDSERFKTAHAAARTYAAEIGDPVKASDASRFMFRNAISRPAEIISSS